MKRLVRATLAGAVLACGAAAHLPASAVMPVLDVKNLVQATQQVRAWSQQYSQMITTINQGRESLRSMSGDRGMSNLMAGGRSYLPPDWTAAMTTMTAAATQIRDSQAILTGSQTASLGPQMSAFLRSSRDVSASQQAVGQQAYAQAAERVIRLQGLTTALAGQTDPKAVMDLQARIASEQAGLANDGNQIASIAQLTQAQSAALENQRNELRVNSGDGSFPRVSTALPW